MPNDPVVSVRLNPELIDAMKKEARRQSFEQDKDITWVDIMRQDLETRYLSKSGTIEARLNQSRMQK